MVSLASLVITNQPDGKRIKNQSEKHKSILKMLLMKFRKQFWQVFGKFYTLFDEPNEVVDEENIYREAGHRRNESPYTF